MDEDARLVWRARRGDGAAFAALVDRHKDALWCFVRQRLRDRAAAEDVAQEAFVVAHERIHALEEPAAFAGWLLGIARNLCFHAVRPGRRLQGRPIDEIEAAAALSRTAEPLAPELAEVEQRDLAEAVNGALGALDDPYRAALTLRYREGRSYQEVARALGLTVGTVSSLIHRGLAMLEPRLGRLAREIGAEKP